MKNDPTLRDLAAEWRQAKLAEEAARIRRIEIEESILPLLIETKANGAVKATPELLVRFREIRRWDQRLLTAMSDALSPWPFDVKWQENRKRSSDCEKLHPETWMEIAEALEIAPAKPGFVWIGED